MTDKEARATPIAYGHIIRARRDFVYFTRMAWPVFFPGQPTPSEDRIRAVAMLLEVKR